MSYSRLTWVNNSAPALDAANLNHLETGVQESSDRLDGYDTLNLNTRVSTAQSAAETAQANANTRYLKPGGGIPSTDMTSLVQDSLSAADSALQPGDPLTVGDNFSRVTVDSWEATRPSPYYIAHRGSGDVIPECSLPGFEHAIQAGAKAMEVSVTRTSDGVLVVNHDTTWDRTMNTTGNISQTPSNYLPLLRITKMTQTGASWSGTNAPPPVTFEEILRRFGGRVVMCCEAKLDACYPDMVAMIERYGLKDSTIIKCYYTSTRIAEAKAAGYRTFVYVDNAAFTQTNMDAIAAAGNTDYLVVPAWTAASDGFGYQTSTTMAMATGTGIPVWVYPCHRRYDATYYGALGVSGFITSTYAYSTTAVPLQPSDRWDLQAVAPGLVVINPADPIYAVGWESPRALLLNRVVASGNLPQFVGLGAYCPTPASGYTVHFEVKWNTIPVDATNKLIWFAFGRADDRYYQTSLNSGAAGNHAYIRTNGTVGVNRHDTAGTTVGTATEATSTALVAGTWVPCTLQVTPTQVIFTRTDTAATATWTDSTNRGGYMHIGKTSGDGILAVRNFSVTVP